MTELLLVEDDRAIVENLREFLAGEGFCVTPASGQKEALDLLEERHFDIVLLDISLSDGNGFAVCAYVKKNTDTPVIFLTASGDECSVVTGLDMGADDYLSKPFGVMELISRVKALLRRSGKGRAERCLTIGCVLLDDERHVVSVNNRPCELTHKEYELLKMLMLRAGIVTGRTEILDQVWGTDFQGESRTLDMHIKTLRQKLGEAGKMIRTVRNVGYILDL